MTIPKKISARREVAYLRALAETGNATLAASHAGVSRTWAYKRRLADPQFDAPWREMVALARERLAGAAAMPPLPKEQTLILPSPACGRGEDFVRGGGAELVLQLGLRKRVQVRRARERQWTAAREERFLEALAATGDVEVAAVSAGFAAASAYLHRARWPAFAARWAEALADYGLHMEAPWIESARCFLSGEPMPADNKVRVTSVGQVLRMLHRSWRMERKAE